MLVINTARRLWRRTQPSGESTAAVAQKKTVGIRGTCFKRVSSLGVAFQLLIATSVQADEADYRRFLEQFKRIAVEKNLSLGNIEGLAGWKLKSLRSYPEYGNVEYVWTDEVGGRAFEISGSGYDKTGELRLRAVLPRPPFCINRQSMLSVFGSNFRKQVAINFENYPDERTLPEAVQSNLAVIGWAPYYEYVGEILKAEVSFGFFFSECAESIAARLVPLTSTVYLREEYVNRIDILKPIVR